MAYIFVTAEGVTLSDGKGGPLIYRDLHKARQIKAHMERTMKTEIEIRKHNPTYGQMRYGQGTDPGTKR